jgi:hypothetical protein
VLDPIHIDAGTEVIDIPVPIVTELVAELEQVPFDPTTV